MGKGTGAEGFDVRSSQEERLSFRDRFSEFRRHTEDRLSMRSRQTTEDSFSFRDDFSQYRDDRLSFRDRIHQLRLKKAAEKAEENKKRRPVSIFALFRYSSGFERLQMFIACICAGLHGLVLPVFTIVFGEVITSFSSNDLSTVPGYSKWFLIIGGIAAVLAFFQILFQLVPAQRAGARMRKLYFESLLSQDATFFDENDSGELVSRITDIQHIQAGMGEKLTVVLQQTTTFIGGFAFAFIYSWKMTLVTLAVTPLLGVAGAIMAKVSASSTGDGLGAYAKAGAIASEAISMIRTVTAFGAQKEECERYERELYDAYAAGVMKAFAQGLGLGCVMLSMFSIFGFSLWYGNRLVVREGLPEGDVFIVFFSVFIGASGLGQAFPSFSAVQAARGAAPRVYEAIDRKSNIDPLNLHIEDGKVLDNLVGDISFHNVDFNYQTRLDSENPDENVLGDVCLDIRAGESQAVVGPSGSGKSTIARLMERFYDVSGGQICIDGEDIRDLNVHWLRSQIGYVGQMPTLFMMSIYDNIALGAGMDFVVDRITGQRHAVRREVTQEEVIAAAQLANADQFIRKLPEGYDTILGERGAMLSGGQKQRICIARALVRNPRILIFDEATSALDAQSERVVQKALERASKGRTTLTIAHRLSSIKNVDFISVLKDGEIVERGTHAELIRISKGAYRRLFEKQNVAGLRLEAEDDSWKFDDTPAAQARRASLSIHLSMTEDQAAVFDEEENYLKKPVFGRTFRYNATESPYIILGLLGAVVRGAAWPVSALILSKVTVSLGTTNSERDIRFYALMYFACGCAALVGNLFQMGCLGVSGERLVYKMRKSAFNALMAKNVGFFDDPENSVGGLTTRLATEASLVRGITGDTLGAATVAISTIATGLGIAFYGCWRIALCVLAVIPAVAGAGVVQMKMMTGFDKDSEKAFAKSGSIASEALDNFTTVSALGIQMFFLKRFSDELEKPLEIGRKKALLSSIAFGVSEIVNFSIWAISFWTGSLFVQRGQCTFEGMMMGVTGLIFSAATLGKISVLVPDIGAAKLAAAQLYNLLDKESTIDPTSDEGISLTHIDGAVAVDSVKFEYPSRPDVPVLHGLSVAVKPGRTLALVGKSGCGKSTIVSLLERFYDVRSGNVMLDGNELRLLNVQNLRSHIGIVSQEPDLFNRTVRENISYGLAHVEGAPVTESMIIDAAKQANAHGFIMKLPKKYDTVVGARGNQLSGGQKQRIAIARSIIRKPRLLLLDEATSALDAESERIAQEALEKASSERTTVMVAHRLSTIKNADSIAVVSHGAIVEQGTHEELLALNGHYANLVQNQLSS